MFFILIRLIVFQPFTSFGQLILLITAGIGYDAAHHCGRKEYDHLQYMHSLEIWFVTSARSSATGSIWVRKLYIDELILKLFNYLLGQGLFILPNNTFRYSSIASIFLS